LLRLDFIITEKRLEARGDGACAVQSGAILGGELQKAGATMRATPRRPQFPSERKRKAIEGIPVVGETLGVKYHPTDAKSFCCAFRSLN
jgi:hypothetical protein